MEIKDLVLRLQDIADLSSGNPEAAHSKADNVLLEFIGDEEVVKAFNEIEKWYA